MTELISAISRPTDASPRTLIDELLEEQQSLSAVNRFAQRHAEVSEPLHRAYYRDLIPFSEPKPGEQYAFEVNLDACTGCKACVSACHSLNGLDDEESWRQVGFIHSVEPERPFQQTVTAACHHCVEPGCMHGCPVGAYDKNEVTGIVRHLDDQCIGCQYCILKCPYDVPKFHPTKGIVRKCDMCQNRLTVGEAPACVQACPTQAIRIVIVDTDSIRQSATPGSTMIAGTFDSSYTKPTSRYVSRHSQPEHAIAADAYSLRSEPAHYPLVLMLVFTQFAVGLYTMQAIVDHSMVSSTALSLKSWALFMAFLGIIFSTLHLGRPLGAWRSFLGLRRSWLSREIVVFGLFVPLAMIDWSLAFWKETTFPERFIIESIVRSGLLLSGWGGVLCSIMIYADTRRIFWRLRTTFWKFFSTVWLLGIGGFSLFNGMRFPTTFVIPLLLLKLIGETSIFCYLAEGSPTPLNRTAELLRGPLRHLFLIRVAFAVMALGFCLEQVMAEGSFVVRLSCLLCLVAGELLERAYFFQAVTAPRMPGMPAETGKSS